MFEILTTSNGSFTDIRLTESRLGGIWDTINEVTTYPQPFVLYGPNRIEEVRTLIATTSMYSPVIFGDGADFDRQFLVGVDARLSKSLGLLRPFTGAVEKFAPSFIEHPSRLRISSFRHKQFIKALSGDISKIDVISEELLEDFIDRIDSTFDRRPLICNIEMHRGIDGLLSLAVWLSRPRTMPAILLNPHPLLDPQLSQIESQNVELSDVLDRIRTQFHLDKEDVDNAYRIWSYSRRRLNRNQAIIRDGITLSAARELCEIVSETFQQKISEYKKPKQRRAPISFEYNSSGISVSRSRNAPTDSEDVTSASAETLRLFCDRLSANIGFHNHVSHFVDSISRISTILALIRDNMYDDGHVVSLGLEFTALSWQVEGVKDDLTLTSKAEAAGFFANSTMFMSRFSAWKSYTSADVGDQVEDSEELKVARSVLRSATSASGLLDTQANTRVGGVLQASTPSKTAPPLLDGVVSSGENLSAAVVSGLGDVVAEAERNGTPADELPPGAIAVVKFAMDHEDEINTLASLRERPWAAMAADLIREVRSTFKI